MNSQQEYSFQAEIPQLMDLIINSFYSNKSIFLRELISNSSDAIDKARIFKVDSAIDISQPKISIVPNKEDKTLTIMDTGIGMTKEELIENLGKIAKSGTKAFMQACTDNKASMIGQFGVGFYSSFLVSDYVTVYTKHIESNVMYKWTSDSKNTYSITEVDENDCDNIGAHGTCIILDIKEDELTYLEEQTLRSTIQKDLAYLNYPISILKKIEETKEVPIEETELDSSNIESGNIDENEPKTETIIEVREEWEQVNTQSPIWIKNADEIEEIEYQSFYKNLTKDHQDAQTYKHFNVEGQVDFTALIYIPKAQPMDLFETKNKIKLKLYVKRVFVTDECEELIPEYLSFVRGIVDSNDLPLNISRELLQKNKFISVMNKNLTKKVIDMIITLSEEDEETYKNFYKNFSKNLKLGVHEDSKNKNKLIELLRFKTTKSNDNLVSFKDYLESIPQEQYESKKMYYISGDNIDTLQSSPFIEYLNKIGYGVLFLTEPIDEYCIQHITSYSHKDNTFTLVDVTKESFDINKVDEDIKSKYTTTCQTIKDILKISNIDKVVLSSRTCETPCVIVSSQFGVTVNMERIIKAQALQRNTPYHQQKRILEINHNHQIINYIHENKDQIYKIKDLVLLMYESACLVSGISLDSPNMFNTRLLNMIKLGLDLESTTNENDNTLYDDLKQELNMNDTHVVTIDDNTDTVDEEHDTVDAVDTTPVVTVDTDMEELD
eukprot:gene4866-5943_t